MHSDTKTYQELKENLEVLGDLPIFSASVNRISQISENPDADAMQLSMEVMKDANLSVKLLRLANSPFYNRNNAQLGSVTQAVMVLGFETIKNISLSLKLLDSLSKNAHDVDMSNMLVHAYLSASFMRVMASQTGVKKVEQSYICGLLHNLGEMLVAYSMPKKYIAVLEKVDEGEKWQVAQQSVLGCGFDDVARDQVSEWGFPPVVTNSIGEQKSSHEQVSSESDFNKQVTTLASQLISSLYLKPQRSDKNFVELLSDLQKTTGMDDSSVRDALNKAFEMGCSLAKEFNLDKKLLAPRVMETGDPARDRFAKQFAYHAQSINSRGSVSEEKEVKLAKADPVLLLETMNEMTMLIAQKGDINKIILKMMEGLCKGAGFSRVGLCLLSPKRDRYAARIVIGRKTDQVKSFIQFSVDKEHDLFSKVMFADKILHITDVTEPKWRTLLPRDFEKKMGVDNFVVSAFGDKVKPLGMIYADMAARHVPVSKAQFDSFQQLVSHAKLALQLR